MAKYDLGIKDCFISANEHDRNMEPANMVDAVFYLARSIQYAAELISGKHKPKVNLKGLVNQEEEDL